MTRADDDFRDFVATFADPLTRFAFLLVANDETSIARAEALTVRVLAHTRRRWREVETTGAPEQLAVELLLGRLPRRQTRRREPAPPAAEPAPPAAEPDDAESADGRADAEARLLGEAIWRAWCGVPPRQRVPLLFADLHLISPRLAGLDVPGSFGSPHRQSVLAAAGIQALRSSLAKEPEPIATESLRDLDALIAQELRERANGVPPLLDPAGRTAKLARRHRMRVLSAAAVVAALAVSGTAVAADVSSSRHKAPKPVTASSRPAPALSLRSAEEARNQVIDWPVRGSAARDSQLLSNLRTSFVRTHPDATGTVQVLLATDASAFRIAYVTANSPTGVLQSWYYGQVGAETLSEGAFSYGGKLLHTSVLASAVTDPAGHSELVVLAPPETTDVRLGDFESGQSSALGLVALPHPAGVSLKDVTGIYEPALILVVRVGTFEAFQGPVQSVQLHSIAGMRPLAGPSGSNRPSVPASSGVGVGIAVERGQPDQALLADALAVAHDWQRTGELSAGAEPVVLWGGTDESGRKVVVLRLKTLHLADLLITVWSGGPTEDSEYLLAPDLPDIPLAFVYGGADGGRVGVLAPVGVARAALVGNGALGTSVPVGPTGFASMPVQDQYGLLAAQTFTVDLFDSGGRMVQQVPVPPRP